MFPRWITSCTQLSCEIAACSTTTAPASENPEDLMTNVVMFVQANYQESILKTALITGANKGIGYETARQLAAKGFHGFVGARNPDAGKNAADTIAKSGAKATFLQLDVS